MDLCPSALVIFLGVISSAIILLYIYAVYQTPVSSSTGQKARSVVLNYLIMILVFQAVITGAFYYLFKYMCDRNYNKLSWGIFAGLVLLQVTSAYMGNSMNHYHKDSNRNLMPIEEQESPLF